MTRHNPEFPLISVITCFRNAEMFLKECIESVLKQDYAHWEMILIDDGSEDQSRQIAEKYARQFPSRIRCFEHAGHRNRGLSESRNLGMSRAEGTYICFLDADDVLLPKKLSHQLSILERMPEVGMLCSAAEYWTNWDGSEAVNQIIEVGVPGEKIYQPPALASFLYPIGKGQAPCMHSLLIRKTAIDKSGGFDNRFRGLYEDQVFLAKMYLCTKIYVSSLSHCKYRQHTKSMLKKSAGSARYHRVRFGFLSWYYIYLKKEYPELTSLSTAARKLLFVELKFILSDLGQAITWKSKTVSFK